jgi:hypothetical protein
MLGYFPDEAFTNIRIVDLIASGKLGQASRMRHRSASFLQLSVGKWWATGGME